MGDPLGLRAYLAMAKLVGILLLIGIVCYQSSQIHKWHKQAIGLSAKLESILTKKDEQKIVTRDRIVIAERKGGDADRVAKKIEAAPLAPGCKTPLAIMGADL